MTKKDQPPPLTIHWWEDSYGRSTCHRNELGLSFDESLLGSVVCRGDDWYFQVAGQDMSGPFKSIQGARRALELAVGAAPLDI